MVEDFSTQSNVLYLHTRVDPVVPDTLCIYVYIYIYIYNEIIKTLQKI